MPEIYCLQRHSSAVVIKCAAFNSGSVGVLITILSSSLLKRCSIGQQCRVRCDRCTSSAGSETGRNGVSQVDVLTADGLCANIYGKPNSGHSLREAGFEVSSRYRVEVQSNRLVL